MSDIFGGQIWCVLPTGFQEISSIKKDAKIKKHIRFSVGSLIKAAAVMRKSKPACSKINNNKEPNLCPKNITHFLNTKSLDGIIAVTFIEIYGISGE
jgi:hypothetical protein